jgi:pimeloyl-ACP methyl ester carboxylesterase
MSEVGGKSASLANRAPGFSAMDTRTVNWTWGDKVVRLNASEGGNGRTILLLPALSSISTRHEMRPLQERLAREYSTFSIDWPGFGDEPRPQVDWAPEIYGAFLSFLLMSVVAQPHAIIAAGHAAGYVLKHAGSSPQVMPRLVLISPTWRGPLPTMMGEHRRFFDRLCRLVDRSTIGPLIYRLNVNPLVVRRMGAGHVYSDPDYLAGDRLHEKLAVARAGGARFASVRFVTGRLDPLAHREEFLECARRVSASVLVIYGSETPQRSLAEIEALAALPGIRSVRLPRGKLSVHEEFADETVEAITPFLQ